MVSILWLVALMVPAQEPLDRGAAGRESREVLVEQLRSKARRIAEKSPSQLLAACADRSSRELLDLTDDQVRLAVDLDRCLRAIVTDSLVNQIDDDPPTTRTVLAARLSPKQVEQRAEVTRHAEAIALEGILSPPQAARWLATHKLPAPPSLGRYPATKFHPESVPSSIKLTCLSYYLQTINGQAKWLTHEQASGSDLFRIMNDPEEQTKLGLTGEQTRLIKQLDTATRGVVRAWLLLAIDPARQPTPEELAGPATPEMVARYSANGLALRASLVDHAEAIVLGEILTTEQAAAVKRRLWYNSGPEALLDPEVVQTIRISKVQTAEILRRLPRWKAQVQKIDDDLGDLAGTLIEDTLPAPNDTAGWAKRNKILAQIRQKGVEPRRAADREVYKVLTRDQQTAFDRLVKRPEQDKEAAKNP